MKVENDSAFPVCQTKSVYHGAVLGTVMILSVDAFLFFKKIPPFTSPPILCPSLSNIHIIHMGMAVK